MKGSNNKFRTDFENAWKDAFDGAESTPNPATWGKIDGELNKAAFVKYKGYYKIYKAVAAVALLISGTISILYFSKDANNNLLSDQINKEVNSENEKLKSPDENAAAEFNSPNESSAQIANPENELNKEEHSPFSGNVSNSEKSESVIPSQQISKNESAIGGTQVQGEEVFFGGNHSALENLSKEQKIVLANKQQFSIVNIPVQLIDTDKITANDFPLVTKKTAFLWYNNLEEEETKASRKQNEVYANVNLNSGFFNPNFEGGNMSGTMLSNAASVINTVPNAIPASDLGIQNSPDASFSYGINMGMKLSGKWVIEGGVAYANYNSTMQTNVALQGTQGEAAIPITFQTRTENFGLTSPSVLDVNATHSLNNSFEFASVPVQAGYVIGQKKLSLIVKAGVASDFFLRNEISENSGSGYSVATNPGDVDSQFRRVYFNGSVGNEVNYSIHDNYSLSVEATYRFALNSFTKPTANFSSNPDGYAIGMVFRYHFKN
ncbi:hypothetical protein [Flexithrix dorotheae]|uniref:hypothetical protein n=1 Tax=Flexithrix dorotheae TaxID=70993 RepID=UPI0003634B70|nr:hypothetical protein [Flexithrix dorotheae]